MLTISRACPIPRGVRNTTAQGSGFVIAIDDERDILTSAHVAAGGMTVEVALPSDNYAVRYNASVVGRAPNGEDIALLALNDATVSASLIPLEFGDSKKLILDIHRCHGPSVRSTGCCDIGRSLRSLGVTGI